MENLFLSKMYCSLQNKVPQLEEGTDTECGGAWKQC